MIERLTPSPVSLQPETTSPTRVGSALAQYRVTNRKLKKLHAIASVKDLHCHSQRTYIARPFVLCDIPVRRPHHHALEYSRRNGRSRLRIIGHPDYGLPFGQDRLLLIWIALMATWQKSRETRFRSAAAILETLGLPKDGRYYKRLIAGFDRVFYSTFYFTRSYLALLTSSRKSSDASSDRD